MSEENSTRISRRSMLARLGLAAGAAYAAPVLLQLGEAQASSYSGASRPSRPSRPSGPSRSFSGRKSRRRSFS